MKTSNIVFFLFIYLFVVCLTMFLVAQTI